VKGEEQELKVVAMERPKLLVLFIAACFRFFVAEIFPFFVAYPFQIQKIPVI
jgi:hypothetical protein